jgi:glycosyltransferase involved in cell wall biosynthesis
VLEAMANGVPVVQPARGSFPELVGETGGGILVAPDDPSTLASGIQQVLEDPVLAARLREAGPAGVRLHYSAAGMARRTLEVISGTLDRARANTA